MSFCELGLARGALALGLFGRRPRARGKFPVPDTSVSWIRSCEFRNAISAAVFASQVPASFFSGRGARLRFGLFGRRFLCSPRAQAYLPFSVSGAVNSRRRPLFAAIGRLSPCVSFAGAIPVIPNRRFASATAAAAGVSWDVPRRHLRRVRRGVESAVSRSSSSSSASLSEPLSSLPSSRS